VTGIRQRFYAQIPAWNSRPVPIGGQPWMPQDAAGDWINSSGCQGNIQLEGMVGGQPFGGAAFFCIRNRPLDAPRQGTLDTTGVIWGQTRIRRHGGYELNIHQFCGWNNFPQCFDYTGAQSMTVVPIARALAITAVPNTGFVAGDSVTFTATSPHPRTVRQWRWIPADSGQPVQVLSHCGTSTTCRARIPGDGLLIVRARVVPWGQLNRIETAHARVNAPASRFIVDVDRRYVGTGDSVRFTLRSDPVRPITQPVWTTIGAPGGVAISGCQPGSTFCQWRVLAMTRKQVDALVNGVAVVGESQVDTVPCPTKDDLMDDPEVRRGLRQELALSGVGNLPSTARKERAGWIYRRENGSHFVVNTPDLNATACFVAFRPPPSIAGATPVALYHTHVVAEGEIQTGCLQKAKEDPNSLLLESVPPYQAGKEPFGKGDERIFWQLPGGPLIRRNYVIGADGDVYRNDETPPRPIGTQVADNQRWRWNHGTNNSCTWTP
jgi:hypothetical protein